MIISRPFAAKSSIEQVLGLTGGELEDSGWNGFTYWYEGYPSYAGEDFNQTSQYRTVICQLPFNEPAEEVAVDGEIWKLVKRYSSSGECDCPFRGSMVTAEQCAPHEEGVTDRCAYCDVAVNDSHAWIYIGDGWHEVVYQKIGEQG